MVQNLNQKSLKKWNGKLIEVKEISESERGEGGFGSTGTK